jgi:hypothetical protein
MTTRELINTYRQRFLHAEQVTRLEASEALVELSALLGNINDEIRRCDQLYYRRFDELLSSEKISFNRAEIKMRASDEYNNLQEAKNLLEMSLELIGSLKYLCRGLDDERGAARNT